jgi:YndJ-like protein
LNRWSEVSAIVGGIVWLALWTRPNLSLGLIERLLLLAILVFTPLCIQLTATPNRHGGHSLPYRIAKIFQPFAAAFAVLAFLLPAGPRAGLLTLPWLLLTVLLALHGLIRLLPRGPARVDEVAIDAGLIYISVGGVWLSLSRLGVRPLGFSAVIVLLTAVHFHYSGFAAPILVGMTGRRIAESDPSSWSTFRILAVAVILGTPLLAAGITFSRTLETLAALLLAGSLFALSFVVIFDVTPSLDSVLARILLRCSGASCALAMLVACVYATGAASGSRALDIPAMARLHGMLNGLGFVLCGLVAWTIVRPRSRLADPGVRRD